MGDELSPKTTGEFRVPMRTWIVWIAIFGGIIFVMLARDRWEVQSERISQHRFEELVDAGQIVRAKVNYNAQNSALNEVIGTYSRTENGVKIEVPFRARVRLTQGLEEKLLSLPQFELRESSPVFVNLVATLLPILILAVFIWFFFIRQIKKTIRSSPRASELNATTAEQQDRFDKILDKWEEQARRMEAVLDKMERR